LLTRRGGVFLQVAKLGLSGVHGAVVCLRSAAWPQRWYGAVYQGNCSTDHDGGTGDTVSFRWVSGVSLGRGGVSEI
jgi:hypothetical protein